VGGAEVIGELPGHVQIFGHGSIGKREVFGRKFKMPIGVQCDSVHRDGAAAVILSDVLVAMQRES
jgi:hypothetical protein